jgi:hypothetical protein
MDVTANKVMNKLRDLIENQKDILGFTPENEEEAKRALKAPNLGAIKLEAGSPLHQVSLGGISDKSNWDYLQFVLQEQTKQGANPDVLAGRGAEAPTLGQEQLIYKNATRVIGNMYNRYMDWTNSIVKKLAWAFWTDPTVEVPVVKEIPGFGTIPAVFSSKEQVGDFYDFVFDIVPYSTQRTSPEIQYQKIMQLMTQWILPTMQLSAMQGAQLDVPQATQMLADYLGVKDFKSFYKTVTQRPGETVPYQMQPTENRKEGSAGQTNDAFGTTIGSQNVNSERQANVEESKSILDS